MAKIGEGLQKAVADRTPKQDQALIAAANRRIEANAAFHESFKDAAKPTLRVYGAFIVRY